MSEHEDTRASLEKDAERARTRLSATVDALESKAEHAKESGAKGLGFVAAVAAATVAMKELSDWYARRRDLRRQRVDLVRKVVLPAPLLLVTATAGILYFIRRAR